MELVPFGLEHGRALTSFGREGVSLAPLARESAGATVVCGHAALGGRLARHPVAGRQLVALGAGTGAVSGADGLAHLLATGTAALRQAGEENETRSDEGTGTRFGTTPRRRGGLAERETVPTAQSVVPNRARPARVVEGTDLALHGRP